MVEQEILICLNCTLNNCDETSSECLISPGQSKEHDEEKLKRKRKFALARQKKWRAKPENKAKVEKYKANYRRSKKGKEVQKIANLKYRQKKEE